MKIKKLLFVIIVVLVSVFVLPQQRTQEEMQQATNEMNLNVLVFSVDKTIWINDQSDIRPQDLVYRVSFLLHAIDFLLEYEGHLDFIYEMRDVVFTFDTNWLELYMALSTRESGRVLSDTLRRQNEHTRRLKWRVP